MILSVFVATKCNLCLLAIVYLFDVCQGINDLQTEADRSVQRCILASLYKMFPGLTVIGEEVWY